MTFQPFSVNRHWTLFLDRDGVINQRITGGYVTSWKEFILLPGVTEAFRLATGIFGRIVVVTNQQGIGKGLMTESDLSEIHRQFREKIESEGGRIDAIYHAPQLESETSSMRKPGTGMALLAKDQFPDIRFDQSVMVGDSLHDMEFGKKLGMYTVLITDQSLNQTPSPLSNARYPSLLSFIKELIIK